MHQLGQVTVGKVYSPVCPMFKRAHLIESIISLVWWIVSTAKWLLSFPVIASFKTIILTKANTYVLNLSVQKYPL